MKNNLKSDRGFTLIEILVVVSIIGILSSILLVGLGGFRSRGRDARRLADLRQAQNGLELYYSKNANYPFTAAWSAVETELKNANIGVSKLANDPQAGKTYTYASNGQSYVLMAVLEEDSPATNEVNGNILGVDCDTPKNYCIQF